MSGLASVKTSIETVKRDFQAAFNECAKSLTPDSYKQLQKKYLKTIRGGKIVWPFLIKFITAKSLILPQKKL